MWKTFHNSEEKNCNSKSINGSHLMCEPVSMSTLFLTSLAMSAATTVASTVGQKQQYDANAANAQQSFNLQNKQTNNAIQQSEAASGLKAQQVQTDMLKAAATAKASANEIGVSGNSVDALIGDYHASEGRYLNSLDTQNQWNRTQAGVEKQGQAATAQRQINSVAAPDFIGAALRIGGGALDAYNMTYGKDAKR
jgi:hypothetical protein